MPEFGGDAGFQLPGYRMGARIGGGGFSSVYEATQLSLDRQVAVKLLYTDLGSDTEQVRFARERQLLSQLSGHRHVVDVFDAGVTPEGRPFIVMRLYRRGCLTQLLQESGPMPVSMAIDIVVKVASALQAAHDVGVLHRDIKPENIFVADDGEPVLGDFGIASLLDRKGNTSSIAFTWAHVAPEILEHPESRLVESDVYSLASTLYLLLAGRPAFSPVNEIQRIHMIMTEPPPPLGRADVPPTVEAVISRGMAKNPSARYPNVTTFADALRQAVEPPVPPAWPVEAPTVRAPAQPVAPQPGWPYPPPPDAPTVMAGGIPQAPRRTGPVVAGGAASVIVLLLIAYFAVPRLFPDGMGRATAGAPTSSAPDTAAVSNTGKAAADPLIISTDLPLQGASADASTATNRAIELYLSQIGNTAGKYPIQFRKYDDSTAAAAQWDSGQCQKNAASHVENNREVAVIGTYNSGCSKIEVPILNQAPNGPLLMVSHGNTNPGLTKPWEPGEPTKYYPTRARNYARVVPTDEVQGQAAAQFAYRTLKAKRVYVLNDNETYGRGVAKQFAASATAAGITVAGDEAWDAKATNYTALFQKIKAARTDAVFLGGIFDNNGAQLIKDKVTVLGDNATVKVLAPDGFTGYPSFNAMSQAQGVYLTFPGLGIDQLRAKGGAAAVFLGAYRARYGMDPVSSYALYAVAAAQVALAAIEASDGTRKGVTSAVFSGDGITIPAAKSILGAEIKIIPGSGDVTVKDITVEVVKGQQETFFSTVTVP